MKLFFHIGRYFLMIKYTFTKFTKWNVLKKLIVQEIDDLIIGSIWIVAFMSFLVGGLIAKHFQALLFPIGFLILSLQKTKS